MLDLKMGERSNTRKLYIDNSIFHPGTLEYHSSLMTRLPLEDCVQDEIGKVAYSFHKKVIEGRHVLLQLHNKLC